MTLAIALTQIGDKKDRTYRVQNWAKNAQPKIFTVKGIGRNFIIFDGEQQLQSFKTLTKCCEFIAEVTTKPSTWKHDAPFNPQFLGAQRPQACQDY
jgi:hypothetical protein